MDLSKKIREYRENHCLTQDEFAKLVGTSLVSVSRWETGKYNPTMKLRKKVMAIICNDVEEEENGRKKI